jgi:predicted SPOUT superfamily RNA methylase MTH1
MISRGEVLELVFRKKFSIAIPASLVSDIPHPREETQRIGMVGRAAAIFGIDEIIVFSDAPGRDQNREIELITTLLSYMETPQYLRKRLFKIRPELKYAGVLPPLRTPHHPLKSRVKDLVDGECREAVVVAHTRTGSLIDVGVERHVLIQNRKLPMNKRVTVSISKMKGQLEATLKDRNDMKAYWGYGMPRSDLTFGKFLKRNQFDLVIATSKHGKPISEVSQKMLSRWRASSRIVVAFGAPNRGLYEIAKQENIDLDSVTDFVVNTFPRQEVETVRTEEAICVTLGILSVMTAKG